MLLIWKSPATETRDGRRTRSSDARESTLRLVPTYVRFGRFRVLIALMNLIVNEPPTRHDGMYGAGVDQ